MDLFFYFAHTFINGFDLHFVRIFICIGGLVFCFELTHVYISHFTLIYKYAKVYVHINVKVYVDCIFLQMSGNFSFENVSQILVCVCTKHFCLCLMFEDVLTY